MGQFGYAALDRQGGSARGEVEAESKEAVVADLVSSGLVPLEVWLVANRRRGVRAMAWWHRAAMAPTAVADFTRQVSALLQAGVTLDRALAITRDLAHVPVQRNLLDQLLTRVKAGSTLSDTLAEQKAVFPAIYIGMVRAGEQGGSLAASLSQLAGLLERRLEIQRRLQSSLIYPAILAAMMVVTVMVIVGGVLPRLESLFAEAQAALPPATRLVLAAGHFLRDHYAILLLGCAGSILVIQQLLRRPGARFRLHASLLRTPGVSEWLGLLEFGRFARVMGSLVAGGVTLPVSAKLALASVENLAIAKSLESLVGRLREGARFGELLSQVGGVPPLLLSLVAVGEQTGQVDRMLLEGAALLESRLQTVTERYLALLVPVLTIVMGLMVAALIGSVLVGILSVNDLAL